MTKSASQRGYDATWRRLREAHLSKEPLCRMCAHMGWSIPATVVDHIKPFRDDWSLRLDPDNLQSLCKEHHDSHKQAEDRSGRVRGCGTDGVPLDPNHHWHIQ